MTAINVFVLVQQIPVKHSRFIPNSILKPPTMKRSAFQISLRTRFIVPMVLLIVALVSCASFVFIRHEQKSLQREMGRKATLLKEKMIENAANLSANMVILVERAVNQYDFTYILSVIDQADNERFSINTIAVMNLNGEVLYSNDKTTVGQTGALNLKNSDALRSFSYFESNEKGNDILYALRPIIVSQKVWGYLRLGLSMAPLSIEIARSKQQMQKDLAEMQTFAVFMGTVFVLIGIIAIISGLNYIMSPIVDIAAMAKDLKDDVYNAEKMQPLTGTDEISALSIALHDSAVTIRSQMETLESKVNARTSELNKALHRAENNASETRAVNRQLQKEQENVRDSNHKLQQVLEQLEAAHEQVVQSEKMASLGRLVAGFAHEINTPIGNSLTATSTMQEQTHFLQKYIQQDEIEEITIERKLSFLEEATNLAMSNLQKAANLVQSFKRTSINQGAEEKRLYNLNTSLQDVLTQFTINSSAQRLKLRRTVLKTCNSLVIQESLTKFSRTCF